MGVFIKGPGELPLGSITQRHNVKNHLHSGKQPWPDPRSARVRAMERKVYSVRATEGGSLVMGAHLKRMIFSVTPGQELPM